MPVEPLTPERRRQQTRDHLLAAAAQVFAERGFHGASLDEVAAVAGFTKGAVYSNFKNKEDLFLALFKASYDREMAALHETMEASEVPPEDRLADFVTLIREQTAEAGPSFGLLFQEFWLYAARNPDVRDQLTAVEDQGVQDLAEVIRTERERRDLEPLEDANAVARIITVLFRGIGLLKIMQPDVVDDAFVQAAVAFVTRGLGVSV